MNKLSRYLLLALVIGGVMVLVYTRYPEITQKQLKVVTQEELKQRFAELQSMTPPSEMSYQRDLGIYNGRAVEEFFICFGDVCPQNGGYYIRYKDVKSETECKQIGGWPIVGFGWSEVYGGCEVEIDPDWPIAWMVYNRFGFELRFPRYWDGFKSSIRELSDGGISVGFHFPYTLKGERIYYNDALQIIKYPTEKWSSVRYPDGSQPPKLAETNIYVYTYAIGQDLGGNEELEKARQDMMKIIKTFKLVE